MIFGGASLLFVSDLPLTQNSYGAQSSSSKRQPKWEREEK